MVAIKIKMQGEVSRFDFTENGVPAEPNILNDLVLDYVNGELAFIYITDTGSEALIIYDIIVYDINLEKTSVNGI